MTLIQSFQGSASDGTALTAVYAEQSASGVALAIVFPGSELPRLCIGVVRCPPLKP